MPLIVTTNSCKIIYLRNLVWFRNSNVNVDRDGSVGIATRYGLDGPEIESRWGARFSAPVQTFPGAHPASYTVGTGSLARVKTAVAWR